MAETASGSETERRLWPWALLALLLLVSIALFFIYVPRGHLPA
ncbi:MAG TPA: hypothetical protein VFE05_12810 [Longimicrobiaceae bacterium]|jgi:MYXO-CTERM domain-containing protein|nr:hypothetical protein [Longimicrobiaceae bacterium]